MAAANTDKFKKAKRKFSTTIAAGGFAQAATTLPLTSTTGLDTDTAIVLVIGAGTSAEEVVTGVVSGSNVINCVRGKEGTTDQAHSAGDTVTMYFTETHWDDVMDGILVQHKQDGTHANTITTDTINENTSANGVTIDGLSIKDNNIQAFRYDGTPTISNPYKFSVYRNAAQNATNGGTAQINYDTELYDTNSNFDSTTNYRYTAPVSGFYFFNARVGITVATRALLSFYKNGSEVYRGIDIATGASGINVTATTLLQLTAADYIDVRVYTDATNVAMTTGSVLNCFSGFLVSRT